MQGYQNTKDILSISHTKITTATDPIDSDLYYQ